MQNPDKQDNIQAESQISVDLIKDQRDKFALFAFAPSDILVELDADFDISFIDGAIMSMLGKAPTLLTGKNFFELVHVEDIDKARHIIKNADVEVKVTGNKIRLNSDINSAMPFSIAVYKIPENDHSYISLALIEEDIDAEETNKRDLHSGLLKKESFVNLANKEIRKASRAGENLYLSMIKLADFAGWLQQIPSDQVDSVMSQISDIIKENSHGGDMASTIASDSYSVLHDENMDDKKIIEAIRLSISKMDNIASDLKFESATIEADANKISAADSAKALTQMVDSFANNSAEFDFENIEGGYKKSVESLVEKISSCKIIMENFKVAMQPIVDIETDQPIYFEALLRFESNPDFFSPFQFITYVEREGLIGEFDIKMIEKALEIIEEEREVKNDVRVSINVSAHSLNSTLFQDSLWYLMQKHQKAAKNVILEITESSKLDNLEEVADYIEKMKKFGIEFSIDDFGEGYSNISYLRVLDIEYVKIDGSYMRSAKDKKGKKLLEGMINLCKALETTPVIEMVETDEDVQTLKDCGAQFAQGFHYSKPTTDLKILKNHS